MEITKEDLKKQTEEIKRHNDVLYEKFRGDIKTIGEGWDATSKKVDATFDLVGALNIKVTDLQLKITDLQLKVGRLEKRIVRLEKRITKIEKDIEIIKSDIAFIKNELKQKVDRDEFATLEKRLILLENKFKRI